MPRTSAACALVNIDYTEIKESKGVRNDDEYPDEDPTPNNATNVAKTDDKNAPVTTDDTASKNPGNSAQWQGCLNIHNSTFISRLISAYLRFLRLVQPKLESG